MGLALRKLHLWLGLLVGIPVLAWSISGFFLAIPPGAVEGEPYVVIEPRRVVLTPAGAIWAVEKHLGKSPELTAISLEQRGENAAYSVFGKNGAFLVNATTGEVSKPPAPSGKTNWVRNAHFFNFAGRHKTTLLLLFSFLSACSTLSGLWLALGWLKSRRGPVPVRENSASGSQTS